MHRERSCQARGAPGTNRVHAAPPDTTQTSTNVTQRARKPTGVPPVDAWGAVPVHRAIDAMHAHPTTHSPPPASHRSPAAVSVRCKKGSAATSASPQCSTCARSASNTPTMTSPTPLDQDSAQCHDSRPPDFEPTNQDPSRHAAPGSLDLSRRLRRRTLRWPSDRAGPRSSTARQSRAQCRGSGWMAGLATSGELGCAPPRTALTDERQPGEYRVRTEGIAV